MLSKDNLGKKKGSLIKKNHIGHYFRKVMLYKPTHLNICHFV